MLVDGEVGFVVEETVEHVGGIADTDVDHFGVERRVFGGGDRLVVGEQRVAGKSFGHLRIVERLSAQ